MGQSSYQMEKKIMTKTDKAVRLLKDGEFAKALSIFRTFRIGFTKDEVRTMEIASETLSGNGRMYEQIGIDTMTEVEKAKRLLQKRYNVTKS